jgi:type VI secretion system protein VasJ
MAETALLDETTELGVRPISGSLPAGAPPQSVPEYGEVEAEIAKLDSLSGQADKIDWPRVAKLSTLILRDKSKDLAAATYLCLSLVHARGYAGLARGLNVVAGLLEGFWESLYPARMRARANFLDALDARCARVVAARVPADDEAAAVLASLQVLERLTGRAAEAFSTAKHEPAPAFADLRRALEVHAARAGEAARKAEEEAKRKAEEEARRKGEGLPTGTALPGEAVATARDAQDLLLRTAGFLRQQDRRDPLAFRLPRAVRWEALQQIPANTAGKTGVPPPPSNVRESLALLRKATNWEALLNQAEARFPEAPLWLDLQHHVDAAMGGLGVEFGSARAAVRGELRALLGRLPALRNMRYADGTPFADAGTQGWIEGEVLATEEGSASGTAGSAAPHFVGEARRLFAEGKIPEALKLAQREMTGASARDRFCCRLELAKLCQRGGKERLAVRLLEALDEDVRRYSLEEWDPALSAEVVKLLCLCRSTEAAGKQPTLDTILATNALYARLCRLDLLSALALDGA